VIAGLFYESRDRLFIVIFCVVAVGVALTGASYFSERARR
jgi:hypothetical protein